MRMPLMVSCTFPPRHRSSISPLDQASLPLSSRYLTPAKWSSFSLHFFTLSGLGFVGACVPPVSYMYLVQGAQRCLPPPRRHQRNLEDDSRQAGGLSPRSVATSNTCVGPLWLSDDSPESIDSALSFTVEPKSGAGGGTRVGGRGLSHKVPRGVPFTVSTRYRSAIPRCVRCVDSPPLGQLRCCLLLSVWVGGEVHQVVNRSAFFDEGRTVTRFSEEFRIRS